MPDDTMIMIPAGNAIELTVDWKDSNDAPDIPTAVSYRVFDSRSGAMVAEEDALDNIAATMTFVIPGDHLPGSVVGNRQLVVVLEALFAGLQDKHTEIIDVTVRRAFV